MIKYREVQVTSGVIDEVICNSCGGQIENKREYIEISHNFNHCYECGPAEESELCFPCYHEIVSKFKIPPKNS